MSDLFRHEVMDEQRNRLHGHVILQLPRTTRLMVAGLIIFIAFAGFWIATSQYARTQTVRGLLVTTEPSVKVFAQRPGRVQEFRLTEGQKIGAGQPLAVIYTDTVAEAGTAAAASASRSVDVRLELAGRRANLSRQNALTEEARLQRQVNSLTRQIEGARGQIRLQEEIVASNRLMFERVREIMERGFISQVDYERRRQNLLNSEQSLAGLNQNLERLEAEREGARSELSRVAIVTQRDLHEIGNDIASLGLEKARYEGERSYVIAAPIPGRVTAIQTARGRQASAQTPLLVIVPDGAELRARLYAPTAAIGMVERGQETTLLFDAFPYQRFGSMKGRILEISRTILDPRDADVPFQINEPVYQIEVALEQQAIDAFGEKVAFQPGMTLTANIVLERQSFLDWLMTPLNAVLNRN